jgi:cytoskeletal protein CcmA (bactofilin family)
VTGATTVAGVTASGDIQAANFVTTGVVNAASVTASGAVNAASAAFVNGVQAATVSTTGNAQAANFITAGEVDCATLAVSGDASITGNLVVAGTSTTINSTELMVRDRDICIGSAGDVQQTESAARDAITLAASGPHATDQSYISTQFGCYKDSNAGGADTPIGELRYNLGSTKATDYFTTSSRLECPRIDAPEVRAGQTIRLNAASGTGFVTLGLSAEGVLGFFYHASEGAVAQEMHSMQAI